VVLFHDLPGEKMESDCSTIVAHSAPGKDDISSPSASQGREVGKFLEKLRILLEYPMHLGLLQHNF